MNNSIWLPNWRMKASLDSTITAVGNKAVSTASPFWYELSDSGELTTKPGSDGLSVPDNTTLEQLRESKGIIVPTVTTTFTPGAFIAFYSDLANQNKMAEDLLKTAEENDYDGFDLDLETIALTTDASVAARVRSVFTSLCGTISQRLRSHNKLVVITVMARWSDDYEVWRDKLIPAVYDYTPLVGLASVLRIMAYDQHAPNTIAGPIAGYVSMPIE